MREIPLDKGMVAIVDDSDYEWLSKYKWRAHNPIPKSRSGGSFYVLTGRWSVAMHRLITNCPKGLQVDHINRNTLDNRRSNLRICTHTENVRNKNPLLTKKSKSKFLGVDLNKSGKRWVARIQVNRKKIYLGTFDTEEVAARIYDIHARAAFGEFANPNFKPAVHG